VGDRGPWVADRHAGKIVLADLEVGGQQLRAVLDPGDAALRVLHDDELYPE